jgi:hypothetical protein
MYVKSSVLIAVSMTAVMVGVFSSYSIVSAYAAHVNPNPFCFTTTATVGLTGACAQSMGQCKKAEEAAVSQGYTIAQHCAKTGGFPT